MIKDTFKLINTIKKMYPVVEFFKDRYFPDGQVYYSQKALIETKKKGRKVVPFVIPVVGGIAVEDEGYRAYEVDAPFIAPKMPITAEQLEQKAFGESPESGRTPAQRENEIEVEHLDDLRNSIARRKELMCTELITTGKVEMKHYASADDAASDTNAQVKELRFYDGSFGNKWEFEKTFQSMTTKERLQEFYKMATELRKRGIRATDIVMTSDVSMLLMTDEDFLEFYNKRMVATGEIDQKELPEGVVANGNININGVVFTMFTYDEYYEAANGTATAFLPAGTIALLQPKMGETAYAQVTFVRNGQFESHAETVVPRLVADEKNNMIEVQTFSRPVMYPYDWEGWLVANINDPVSPKVATLSGLTIGSLVLTPTFATATTSYTATTSNAADAVTALAAEGTNITIKVNGNALTNGSNASWTSGSNTVKITASATGLESTEYTVTVTYEPVATLSTLSLGSLTLDPTFSASTTEYETTTTNDTNTITATAAAGLSVVIKNGDTTVTSGSAATWETGENTVTITVSGTGYTENVYTVTVTKS